MMPVWQIQPLESTCKGASTSNHHQLDLCLVWDEPKTIQNVSEWEKIAMRSILELSLVRKPLSQGLCSVSLCHFNKYLSFWRKCAFSFVLNLMEEMQENRKKTNSFALLLLTFLSLQKSTFFSSTIVVSLSSILDSCLFLTSKDYYVIISYSFDLLNSFT